MIEKKMVEGRKFFQIEVGNMSDAEARNFIELIKEQYQDTVKVEYWDAAKSKWVKK